MDPDATLADLMDAWRANDWGEVEMAAADLLGWLALEGYVPVVGRDALKALLACCREVARKRAGTA